MVVSGRSQGAAGAALPVADPSVIFKSLSDGAVLFSPSDEVYFGLNEVGACIWELLPPVSRTLEELCSSVHRRYPEVALDAITSDVIALLNDLEAQGLVSFGRSQHPEANGGEQARAEAV